MWAKRFHWKVSNLKYCEIPRTNLSDLANPVRRSNTVWEHHPQNQHSSL